MNGKSMRGIRRASLTVAAAMVLAPMGLLAQSQDTSSTSSSSSDKWLHVRVVSTDGDNATVKVNVPLEMAEKVLPAINRDQLHNGKVKINEHDMNGVDLKQLLDAIRTSKDGEFVTVRSDDADVRVAKKEGYMLVHVTEKNSGKHGKAGEKASEKSAEKSRVEVKVPLKVVDALFSAGKDELDVLAALKALAAHGDTELVSVKSDDSTVHIWLDSKNIAD